MKKREHKVQNRMPIRARVAARHATIELAKAVREWPKLEIFTKGEIAKCRGTVANEYGKAFASKASDRLCQALATVQSFRTAAITPQPRPTILEFSAPQVKTAEFNKRVAALSVVETVETSPPVLHRTALSPVLAASSHQQAAGP